MIVFSSPILFFSWFSFRLVSFVASILNIIKLIGWMIVVPSEIAHFIIRIIYLRAHTFYDRMSNKNGGIDYEYIAKMAFSGGPLF